MRLFMKASAKCAVLNYYNINIGEGVFTALTSAGQNTSVRIGKKIQSHASRANRRTVNIVARRLFRRRDVGQESFAPTRAALSGGARLIHVMKIRGRIPIHAHFAGRYLRVIPRSLGNTVAENAIIGIGLNDGYVLGIQPFL